MGKCVVWVLGLIFWLWMKIVCVLREDIMIFGFGDYFVGNEVFIELLGRLLLCELRCLKDFSFFVYECVDFCLLVVGEIDVDRRNFWEVKVGVILSGWEFFSSWRDWIFVRV